MTQKQPVPLIGRLAVQMKMITMDQLRQDVGNMVEKITKVIAIFRQCQLKMEEYVCLKVIAMASQEGKIT